MNHPIKDLTKKGWGLWIGSIGTILTANILSGNMDIFTIAACIGITSLILAAKGNVWAQILMIVFSILYGILSWRFRYWGEMITYLGMTRVVYHHVDPASGRKRKRSSDPETASQAHLGTPVLGNHNDSRVLLYIADAGYAQSCIQHHLRHDEFPGRGTDHAAFIVLCTRICFQRFGADRSLGSGIAGEPGVYTGCGQFRDFLFERYVWLYSLEKEGEGLCLILIRGAVALENIFLGGSPAL